MQKLILQWMFMSIMKVSALEKEVIELKKDDLLNNQVTALVDGHLDLRLGATRDEFMTYLSASITVKITKQVKIQLPQILPKEVSNFALPVIKSMVTELLEHAVLAKESSQLQSTYEAAASLTEFELKKILIDKMDENKDEDPSVGSDRRLKKRKTCKDVEPTKGPKTKESNSGSSKGTKSQSKSSRKSVQVEEPEFEVADSDMPQDQEENLGNDDKELKRKTPQQGLTQSWLMTLASSADKPLKTFNELMSTPIDFSAYIMNGLNITNMTQETLLGPAFNLLKGTRTNFAKLEYDFEEFMNGNHQIVPVDYFFNNDLKYLQGGILTMTYTTSITKTKATQDQRKTFYGYARGLESSHDMYYTKRILAVTQLEVMRKHGYGYLREIEVRRADNNLYTFKEGDFSRIRINDIEDMLLLVVKNRLTNILGNDKKINVTKPETTRPGIQKRDPYTPYQDPQGFIYVDNKGRNRLMRLDELYKLSDETLIGLQTSLDDITKNILIEYLPQRRWSSLEKKRAHIMIKAIGKQLKEKRMMRSFEKFVGRRNYGTDLRLLQ
ncbi:hypothetical protein Tco_0726488 [Tanacetum coccineum]|uniref:Uncharacterized protein n=1 Tax=Tanacetum coccineum TaxID=301880 RepID=A0ABQ4YGL9_9ASTR